MNLIDRKLRPKEVKLSVQTGHSFTEYIIIEYIPYTGCKGKSQQRVKSLGYR